jgi:hypothetical protein
MCCAEHATNDGVLPQVARNLDSMLERSLKVKHVGAGGSAARRR